jgi:hypothetical protein
MRLSEKTIELNICAQISQNIKRKIIWFGLTQLQEARAGFDAAFNLNGRIVIFQFKTSNYYLKNNKKRFYLEHAQLQNLRNRVNGYYRSIFYVFPMIGNTRDLNIHNGDFYNTSWLLDVSYLTNPFPPPLTKTNPPRLRKNNNHYADLNPPLITIHSDPFETKLNKLSDLVESRFSGSDGLNNLFFKSSGNYDKLLETMFPTRIGLQMAILL